MSETPQRKKASLPPKRGQIKAQIFTSLVNSVASTISKTGESLRNVIGNGVNSGSGYASSTPPPSSGYNSETNSSDVT
ncbi:hypothetical protein AAZX31_15G042500 [Glycine max]|uniref:Uncharacterized protein n=2 Tax=Glycine subgen. Soja TaxID=1462606 RepID=K7M9K3_SOYBN|nr:hypothetical protein JHK87_041317 [Glycine soja]KAG4948189.1 hypothetical protein JHK86_041428 [Glycine max]KAG4955655.1 hypothetical protein JHK85_042035 [Glycine max]KAG5104399.1 hypothetical protein JHK82_041369 [Glycine max]KAG5115523.1 hypothetical protein JHK84_041636 [Glycine max]